MTAVTDQTEILRDILGRTGQSRRLVDERLRAFERIPFLTDELRESHIQLLPDDPVPEKIDPVLIRKSTPDNCLLSAPLRVGEVLYFNILKDTEEIRIDHDSDHFVGLFILEGVRQIGMAMSHVIGDIPLDTRMSLQEFSLTFYNYIELDFPIVARAVCTLSFNDDLRGDHTAFIDVRQNGITCLAGTSSGRLFDTEERYQRIRTKTRAMNERYAEEFAARARGSEEGA
jgi:2-oxo-3-(phosphooxy)propyl 3-oxoalkanoate synthase